MMRPITKDTAKTKIAEAGNILVQAMTPIVSVALKRSFFRKQAKEIKKFADKDVR